MLREESENSWQWAVGSRRELGKIVLRAEGRKNSWQLAVGSWQVYPLLSKPSFEGRGATVR